MTNHVKSTRRMAQTALPAAVLAAASSSEALNEKLEKFLADLQSENADVRYATWIKADTVGARIVPELGKLLASGNPGVAKAAGEALRVHVHDAAKEWDGRKRKNVMKALMALTEADQPMKARIAALRHLSTIGDAEAVPKTAEWLKDKELREEAVFCLERIPGPEAGQALMEALKSAPDDFKPRLINALGHRKEEQAVELLAAAVDGGEARIAIPAMKAIAQIGKKPLSNVTTPEFESLSVRDKTTYLDSGLRYADAQIEQGDFQEAMKIVRIVLKLTQEEHHLCGAIICLGKIGGGEAAKDIGPLLKNESPVVKDLAQKTLIALKGEDVDALLQEAMQTAPNEEKKLIEPIIEARKK
ncbi:MAG: HEAT repeat domain-containing protein [Candidatus Omnitrophota bacterium]